MTEHALVVGGSSGIGLATACTLLGLGFRVTIAGRSRDKLDAAVAALPAGAAPLVLDAADTVRARDVLATLAPLDHLVLALGGGQGGGPFASVDLASVRSGFEEKVFPHIAVAQAALPMMSKAGSITFLSAVSAQAAIPGTAGLAAANAAIAALVPVLAIELRPRRVNAVSPGVIDTPWWSFLPDGQKAAVFADFASRTPAGRVGTAEDVAQAVAFLVTNTFMTGHTLICDGGLRLAA